MKSMRSIKKYKKSLSNKKYYSNEFKPRTT